MRGQGCCCWRWSSASSRASSLSSSRTREARVVRRLLSLPSPRQTHPLNVKACALPRMDSARPTAPFTTEAFLDSPITLGLVQARRLMRGSNAPHTTRPPSILAGMTGGRDGVAHSLRPVPQQQRGPRAPASKHTAALSSLQLAVASVGGRVSSFVCGRCPPFARFGGGKRLSQFAYAPPPALPPFGVLAGWKFASHVADPGGI